MALNIEFYGSSSETANKHYGGLSDYRSSEEERKSKIQRKINDTIKDILGGVRSAVLMLERLH